MRVPHLRRPHAPPLQPSRHDIHPQSRLPDPGVHEEGYAEPIGTIISPRAEEREEYVEWRRL